MLGTAPSADPVVYEERDHSFYMGVSRSGDDKYIAIDENSTLSSELRFIPANQPPIFASKKPCHPADEVALQFILIPQALRLEAMRLLKYELPLVL